MLRLNPQRRVHIPNHLALVGALALALSVLACYETDPGDASELPLRDAEATTRHEAQPAPESEGQRDHVNVSNLLFRAG